ncbi:MAG: hypothetical protein FJX53_15640, partial [Alphaproteobacteria bacterium]|nr:hypothetical protein [Alphaproteobacteria bacterium]
NHWAAEEALAARAVRPDCAPLLIHTASEFFASRQTAMPAARFVRNAIQACAHGANAAPAVNGTLDQDDPRLVPQIRSLGRYLERNASWYAGLRSLAKVALVRSEDSLNWGPDAGRMAGQPGTPGHVAEFRGCYEMAAQLRHPCAVLPAGGLNAADLARYGAVVLPAVSCLGAEDAAAIDAYIVDGGAAIVTADTGACDRDGRPASGHALAAMPALPGVPLTVFGAYFKLADPALRRAVGGAPHVGADGEFWSPPVPAGATCDLRLVGPFRNNAPEFTTVAGPGDAPGLIALRRGAGRMVWLPWRIGALFHAAAIPEYAALFGRVLEEAVGPAPIRTDAPDAVECILYAHDRGEVLHLVNGAALQSKPLVGTTPLAGFEVRVRSLAVSAVRLDSGAPLALRREGEEVVLRIDRLDVFVAIALLAPSECLIATN